MDKPTMVKGYVWPAACGDTGIRSGLGAISTHVLCQEDPLSVRTNTVMQPRRRYSTARANPTRFVVAGMKQMVFVPNL